jgi:hypothetical protein
MRQMRNASKHSSVKLKERENISDLTETSGSGKFGLQKGLRTWTVRAQLRVLQRWALVNMVMKSELHRKQEI